MFIVCDNVYVGCHRPTTTLLLYLGLGQAVNGALTELAEMSVAEMRMLR